MKKKTKTFVLVAACILAAIVFAAAPAFAASPSDTSGHWAEGQILAGINYGYINGYPDGTFVPDGTITRAEFVTIINKARNYTAMTNIPFRDVPVNEWYFAEVQRAYSAGYIQGDSEGNFKPGAQITRQEVAVILNRIAPGGDASQALTGVRDAALIDAWALPAVSAAYSKGYITGDAEGNFNPQSPLKRGEAVTIVNRVLGITPLSPGANLAALSVSNISITDVKADAAILNLTATRDGNVYWVVLTGESATTPSAEQVLNGRGADERSAYGSGSRNVYANGVITANVTSLQAEQSYKICAVARDAAANLSPVAIRTFTTSSSGDTGEEWLNSNFSVSNIGNNAITLTVNSSRAGNLYYVVVEDPNKNVKTPSQAYIRNGRDANNSSANVFSGNFVVSAGVNRSLEITGLKSGTNYKIFGCVYEGTSTNSLFSKVKSYAFTTTGSNANWITTFDLQSNTVGATNATLNVRTDRAGTFYYVVTTESRQPTADRIRNGRDYNNSASIANSIYINSASNTYPIGLTNLQMNTRYYVFGVLYVNANDYSEIKTFYFTTGTGTAASPLSKVSYSLSATTSGGINFTNSGYSYTATEGIKLDGTNAGAPTTTITIERSSAASSVAVTLNGANIYSAQQNNATVSINNGSDLNAGKQNPVVITVTEPGKSTLTYTINIYKP
ncbi:MAG: S-layer homology domain-containing protein [Clostridiales Family XIII bacterium]|jgi:hypothetical protein|nr:S-layer homology domain-containing protein [Clostridiales Family XIII bacterium]